MLKSLPGALGVSLSPLLFGTVSQDGKAIVGSLLALGLFLCAKDLGRHKARLFSTTWGYLFLGFLIFQCIPLPPAVVEFLSPEKFRLDKEVPLDGLQSGVWSCLTLSRSRFFNRCYELLLAIAAFQLIRESTKHPLFPRMFLCMLAVSVALLGGAEVWYRADGGSAILGLWSTRFSRGAGTFENRNLFANWIYVATLLCMGIVIRYFRPIRSGRNPAGSSIPTKPLKGLVVLSLLGIGTFMAILSGSRGGLLVFGCGTAFLILALAIKTRDQKRWAGFFVLLSVSLLAFLFYGEFVFSRLTQLRKDVSDPAQYGKLKIWNDGFRISREFPWTGTGLGAFVTAHRLYKSMDADIVATHAENDYLQTLVETGAVGATMACLFLAGALLRIARKVFLERHGEPEMLLSGCAAIIAFLTHSIFEFVAQNSSTLILASSVMGLLAGILDAETRPTLPSPLSPGRTACNYAFPAFLGTIAVLNGLSFWHHRRAVMLWQRGDARPGAVEMARAVRFWPWSTENQLVLVRAQVMSLRSLTRLEQRSEVVPLIKGFEGYMKFDPFNWELRVEDAWMSLIFDGPTPQALERARAACRLNPKQPKIPFAFAKHLKSVAPDEAIQFLRLVPFGPTTPQCLAMALELDADPSVLWTLVPATSEGLSLLGEFAFSRGMPALASRAFEKLAAKLPRAELCKKYLAARQPGYVIRLLDAGPRTREEDVLLAKSFLDLGSDADSLRHSQPLWAPFPNASGSREWAASLARNRTLSHQQRVDSERFIAAVQFAERLDVGRAKEQEIEQLRKYAADFPSAEGILRSLFDIELRLGNIRPAARISLKLAELGLSAMPATALSK